MKKQNNAFAKNIFMVSLGCSKNLVDTEIIAGSLLSAGYNWAFEPDEAGIYIINTCAFLPAARQEAFEAIEDAVAWKEEVPGRMVVVSGCLPQWDKENECRNAFPEVDLWTGVNDLENIVKHIEEKSSVYGKSAPVYLYNENTPRLQLTVPHMAYLKIADGCNNCCTYCAIPGIRGTLRSRTVSSVVKEAENLIANGVKELLVIAQDITAFGADRPESGETLVTLLEALNNIEGEFVIRLLYTHPAHYTDEFIDFLARRDTKVLPYIDMPLQHISDRILKDMHRHVTKARILEILKALRERVKDLTLRTTFITGFPGETEEEFNELLAFIKEQKFERCGVFPYSAEPRTPAAKMKDQVPAEVAEERAAKLMRIQKNIMKKANKAWIGREVTVLVDAVENGFAQGRAMMDAPEIDNSILFPAPGRKVKAGTFCQVRITDADSYEFTGEIVKGNRKK